MGRYRLTKLIFTGFVGTDVAIYGIDRRSVPWIYGLRMGHVYPDAMARAGPSRHVVGESSGTEQLQVAFYEKIMFRIPIRSRDCSAHRQFRVRNCQRHSRECEYFR